MEPNERRALRAVDHVSLISTFEAILDHDHSDIGHLRVTAIVDPAKDKNPENKYNPYYFQNH